MHVTKMSTAIVTPHIAETRRFYEQHLDAAPIFDAGWYVTMLIGDGLEVSLMAPRDGQLAFQGGAMLNVCVPSADDVFRRLEASGVTATVPLEDHPWGDRGFGVIDPSGVVVYVYHPIPMSAEFAAFVVRTAG